MPSSIFPFYATTNFFISLSKYKLPIQVKIVRKQGRKNCRMKGEKERKALTSGSFTQQNKIITCSLNFFLLLLGYLFFKGGLCSHSAHSENLGLGSQKQSGASSPHDHSSSHRASLLASRCQQRGCPGDFGLFLKNNITATHHSHGSPRPELGFPPPPPGSGISESFIFMSRGFSKEVGKTTFYSGFGKLPFLLSLQSWHRTSMAGLITNNQKESPVLTAPRLL